MVEASSQNNDQEPRASSNMGDSDNSLSALQWTAQLVSLVDKKLRAAVSADELKKLCLENSRPEFKKILS